MAFEWQHQCLPDFQLRLKHWLSSSVAGPADLKMHATSQFFYNCMYWFWIINHVYSYSLKHKHYTQTHPLQTDICNDSDKCTCTETHIHWHIQGHTHVHRYTEIHTHFTSSVFLENCDKHILCHCGDMAHLMSYGSSGHEEIVSLGRWH